VGIAAAVLLASVATAAGKGQQIPIGVNKYDYLVYKPLQEFDSRKYGDITKRGDAYNDHFHVIWDETRRVLFAFWTQASWEGAPDMHVCFSKSADKGMTWTKPVLLAGSETRQYPRTDAYYQQPLLTKSGRLYCLWTERNVGWGYVGSWSDDAGETWAQPAVMRIRPMDQDNPDPRIGANSINWQLPLRIGREGRYFVACSRHGKAPYDDKKGCKIEFWEFFNIDDDPDVREIRLDYFATNREALGVDKLLEGAEYFTPKKYPNGSPEGPAVEEASLVKLPDGRLFALMRSSVGSPVWSQSRDDGRTWSGLKVLVDANGKPFLHPRSPCPIYDRKGGEAASGEYFAFIHNTFDFNSTTACQPRPQLYLIAGRFDPKGEQPIRFAAPQLFAERTFGNSFYTSYTVVDGTGILWFPDVKYYLLGREIGSEWFTDGSD
jgi:hypothetical protein